MVQVIFKGFGGGPAAVVEARIGKSLMLAAKDGRVEGIEAICGGSMACGTCHVHVDPGWYDRLPSPSPEESEVLAFSADPSPTSRLSCQIVITEALDGLSVTVPESQL